MTGMEGLDKVGVIEEDETVKYLSLNEVPEEKLTIEIIVKFLGEKILKILDGNESIEINICYIGDFIRVVKGDTGIIINNKGKVIDKTTTPGIWDN